MTEFSYDIRSYRPADFNQLVRLYRAAELQEPLGRPDSPQAVAEKLARPNYHPEQDLMVVQKGDTIVGFLDMVPELAIGRIIVDGWLQPEHRRQGLAGRLLDFAMRRARASGAKVIHVNINEKNDTAKKVLEKLGFQYVRRFLELRLDLTRLNQRELDNASRGCRHLQKGEEDRLTRLQNRSFAEHWGYNPNTVEMTLYRLETSHRSPQDVVLFCKEDRLVGYCWTEITKKGQGRIYMIGSDPDYRGKGIGRKMLLAGLARLKEQNVSTVWLTVDSENETACALYNSTGFELYTSYLWYEKAVD